MKALVMKEYREFSWEEVPDPVPGPDEVRVRVKACAICGSDVHGSDGSTGRRRPPVIMGHEASGVVDLCGAEVRDYQPGDRVTFDSTISCGLCPMCRAGHVNLCAARRVLGVSCAEYRQDGAFAEYVCVPARILYRLPEGVSFVQAAMAEPLSVALHAALRTPVQPGSSALIVGVGTIGMLTLQVVRSLGAGPIIAADIDEARLAAALGNGATHAVHTAAPEPSARVLDLTEGRQGVDLAFDATGIAATVDLCARSVALNGRVVLIGNLAPSVPFPLQLAVTRQQSWFGSCASAGEYPQCLELIASGAVDVEAMISRVAPMREGGEWFDRLYRREPGLYKVVLEA